MQWVWGLIGVIVFIVLIVCGVRIAFAAMIGGLTTFFLVYGNPQAVAFEHATKRSPVRNPPRGEVAVQP